MNVRQRKSWPRLTIRHFPGVISSTALSRRMKMERVREESLEQLGQQ